MNGNPVIPVISQSHFPHHSDAFLSDPRSPHHLPPHVTIPSMDNGSRHQREDCWTESATRTLIDSWGHRYLQLNRGNLRQKDWKDVADAVNADRDGLRPRRTDVQCKNRIDTLKKKYKLEKSKHPIPSNWPFFHRLHDLIGTASTLTRKKITTPKSSSVTLTVKSNSKPNPNLKAVVYSGRSLPHLESPSGMESLDFTEGAAAYKELAMSIVRFGEVYERMENSKQEEMMKLEKQRMEFTREVEFQRLNMFMETTLELEKMENKKKRPSATDSLSTDVTMMYMLSAQKAAPLLNRTTVRPSRRSI